MVPYWKVSCDKPYCLWDVLTSQSDLESSATYQAFSRQSQSETHFLYVWHIFCFSSFDAWKEHILQYSQSPWNMTDGHNAAVMEGIAHSIDWMFLDSCLRMHANTIYTLLGQHWNNNTCFSSVLLKLSRLGPRRTATSVEVLSALSTWVVHESEFIYIVGRLALQECKKYSAAQQNPPVINLPFITITAKQSSFSFHSKATGGNF